MTEIYTLILSSGFVRIRAYISPFVYKVHCTVLCLTTTVFYYKKKWRGFSGTHDLDKAGCFEYKD
jgi:hypothetical protein